MRTASVAMIGIAILASLALAESPKPNATVTLKKLTEKRELSIVKDDFAGWENGIELALHIDGPDVQGARKYGKLKATKAVDDVGTDLTAKGEGPKFNSDESFREIREPQTFGRNNDKTKPTGFDVELKLSTPSARSARMISLIVGEVQVLVGGEKKIVQVKPIKANLGKTIDDPALKSLGVTFTLIDPAKRSAGQKLGGALLGSGKSDKSVSAEISGAIDAITEVTIVDSAGKKLSSSSMWQDEPGKRSITYDLEQPMPDDAVLQIEVWPGQKTVTVPFELKDVKLP